jgi:UDP-N-acetylglucosamine 3-dehydrogenase
MNSPSASTPPPGRTHRAAIIGTGRPRGQDGATGAAISRFHVQAYLANGCDVVALADIRPENAEAFRTEHALPNAQIFTDYKQMLNEAQPDIVSVCTWPHLHAEMVIAAAEAGIRAVHCEKPMAPTFGEAQRMHQACVERGTQLTVNHQRRFEAPYTTVRRLLQEGAVGQLVQIQAACSNLYDWGTHWFDMLFFYNGDVPAEWVIGQIDSRTEKSVFGVRLDDQGLSYAGFRNGVRGLLITGDSVPEARGPYTGQRAYMGAVHRIIGTEGVLELGAPDSKLRLLNAQTGGFREIELDSGPTDITGAVTAAIADALRCLVSGDEPQLSSYKALRTSELIFATYESSRRRARVDLPLRIEDNPLLTMLDRGEIGPNHSTPSAGSRTV